MVLKRIAILCLLICVGFTFVNCPSNGVRPKSDYAVEVTPEMRTEFSVAEKLYRGRQYTKAMETYKLYIENYSYNKLTDEARYKVAKIYFLEKKYSESIGYFKKIINTTPDEKYAAKSGHYAGYAAFLKDDFSQSYQYLKAVKPMGLPVKLRLQYYSLAIFMAQKADDYHDFEIYSALKLYDLYESNAAHLRSFHGNLIMSYKKNKNLLDVWVLTPATLADLPDWLEKYPNDPAKEMVDLKLAKAYFKDKPDAKATRERLLMFLRNYPRSEAAGDVQNMLDQLGVDASQVEGRQFKIGVITPSGDGEQYGQAILNGVKCATGENGACGEKSAVQYVHEESGWDEKSLREAFAKVLEQDVAAIVALVPGQLTLEAAIVANEKHVPVILITQQSGIMQQGSYVFQMGLLPEQQIVDLVQAAIQKGQRQFGIFYPDILYGEVMTQLFEREVEKQGGKIITKVSYNKKSSDSYAQVRKLKKHIKLKGNSNLDVGFDALFIPDSFLQINNIVTSLKFHQVTGFPLLGTNTWNDNDLSKEIGELFPGSFFVDLYNSRDSSRITREFHSEFTKSFSEEPSVLNALGYDAVMMLRHAANLGGTKDIHETLNNKFGFRGVTGVRGFEKGKAPIVQTSIVRIRREFGVD